MPSVAHGCRYRSDPYSRYDRGGAYDRYGDRGYSSRAYERPPPRGYERGYSARPVAWLPAP